MTEAEKFVRGNARLERALSDAGTKRRVENIRAEMAEADREHAMHLASIRRAANLTQVELARRMGIKQAAVSGLEAREDMLLSTLAKYLRAVGASEARVVVTIAGQEIEYALPPAHEPSDQSPASAINEEETSGQLEPGTIER